MVPWPCFPPLPLRHLCAEPWVLCDVPWLVWSPAAALRAVPLALTDDAPGAGMSFQEHRLPVDMSEITVARREDMALLWEDQLIISHVATQRHGDIRHHHADKLRRLLG